MIETATEARVRRIVLNRPEKRNALNAVLCREIARAFDDAENDDSIGAILLSANGPAFCAGMDLAEVPHADPAELNRLHEIVFTRIDRLRKPVIAAVEGSALGGGVGLVVNAHIVIASSAARFGLTEIRIGLWPVLIMRALVLAMGERRATELSLTGRTFGAEEARQYGLVAEVTENAMARASEIAHECSRQSAPAMAAGLGYARFLRNADGNEAAQEGQLVRDELMRSAGFRDAVQAFLARKS